MANSRSRLLLTAQHATVLAVCDGDSVTHAAYGPHGHGADAGAFGFNGELREQVLSGYLLGDGHRLFAPALMRFSRPDHLSPFGSGGLNAYAYCNCDPINYRDPSGRIKVKTRLPRRSLSRGNEIAASVPNSRRIPKVTEVASTSDGRTVDSLTNKRHGATAEKTSVNAKNTGSEHTGAPNSTLGELEVMPSWNDPVHAKAMYDAAVSGYGEKPNVADLHTYTDPATGRFMLDTAQYDAFINYQTMPGVSRSAAWRTRNVNYMTNLRDIYIRMHHWRVVGLNRQFGFPQI